MADYTKFVALAQRLIAKRGRQVSLLKLSAGSLDPAKPWNGLGSPAVEIQVDGVRAVFLDPKGADIKSVVTDSELLKRVTDVALVAPGEVDFSHMTVIADGERCRIEWVQVLKPGDIICLYVFGIAR